MSDYMAIADVGQTLMSVLLSEMQADTNVSGIINDAGHISLLSPADVQNDNTVRLSVYLYRIVEDAYCKNRYPAQGTGAKVRKAPLTLDLYYMVTPLFGDPRSQQLVLGKTMQVLYDRASMGDPDLQGSLAGGEPVRVILNPATLEENTRVWQALEISYRLSVCYIVRVVIVDSRQEQFIQPVLERHGKFGQPDASMQEAMMS